jgi:hypothetical protein
MPITPNIIHTAKHTVNASVLMIATDHCRVLSRAAPRAMHRPHSYVLPF